jgi:hypothetical protein
MALITPVIPAGTASLGSALITPGWPLATVPASNPLAGRFATTPPDPNETAEPALLYQAEVQSGHTSDRVV